MSSGTNSLHACSWHEGFEKNPNLVVLSGAVSPLKKGQTREAAQKKDNPEYRHFHAMWTDVRSQIKKTLPHNGSVIGEVMIKAGRFHPGIDTVKYE